MEVMLANANQDIIKDIFPEIEFNECTKNTCTFKISTKKFRRLIDEVKRKGYNPFALFAW